MENKKILFIGAGKMATAIAAGITGRGFDAAGISAFDISGAAAENFRLVTGARAETRNLEEMLQSADIVILAVKPQQMESALKNSNVETALFADKLLVSIAAGVTINTIQDLSKATRVVRVMPNTPVVVGEAASAWCASDAVSDEDVRLVEKIFKSSGTACRVDEKLLDAVTGVSGSGPAYVLDFIQALADGGVNAGLPRALANELAAQTVMGTAKLVLESGKHPAVLRDEVTSPGGTTAKALAVLEKNGFKGIIIEAVLAAARRSCELGKK